MTSFGSEFHSFVAVAENDLSQREVLDLSTDREPFVAGRKLRLWVSNVGFNRFEMYSGVRSFIQVNNIRQIRSLFPNRGN